MGVDNLIFVFNTESVTDIATSLYRLQNLSLNSVKRDHRLH